MLPSELRSLAAHSYGKPVPPGNTWSVTGASKVPSPRPRNVRTLALNRSVTAASILPSQFQSPPASETGKPSPGIGVRRGSPRVPSPRPGRIVTEGVKLPAPAFATATSKRPSRLKSAMTGEMGCTPATASCLDANVPPLLPSRTETVPSVWLLVTRSRKPRQNRAFLNFVSPCSVKLTRYETRKIEEKKNAVNIAAR